MWMHRRCKQELSLFLLLRSLLKIESFIFFKFYPQSWERWQSGLYSKCSWTPVERENMFFCFDKLLSCHHCTIQFKEKDTEWLWLGLRSITASGTEVTFSLLEDWDPNGMSVSVLFPITGNSAVFLFFLMKGIDHLKWKPGGIQDLEVHTVNRAVAPFPWFWFFLALHVGFVLRLMSPLELGGTIRWLWGTLGLCTLYSNYPPKDLDFPGAEQQSHCAQPSVDRGFKELGNHSLAWISRGHSWPAEPPWIAGSGFGDERMRRHGFIPILQ